MTGGRDSQGDGLRHLYRSRRRGLRRVALVVALIVVVSVVALGVALVVAQRAKSPAPSPRASGAAGPKPSGTGSPAAGSPRAPFAVAAWSRGDIGSLRVATAAHALTEVDLDWWHARSDGALVPESVDPAFVREAHADHLRVYATVTNRLNDYAPFDPGIAAAILATPATRARHVARLVDLCETNDYDGIDLDWESLRAADRASFTAFVRLLAARLHAAGKRLSIAVYDKTTDYPTGTEAGARAAEDYRALGQAVDEFKVMTFGQHGSFTGPGPLAAPAWTARVLSYAESQVSPAKIYLGLPFYGFDWGQGAPRYLLWSDAQALLATYRPAVLRSASGEPYFHYTADGVRHTVYFEDPVSIARKVAFAAGRQPPIAGVAIWVMGGEDRAFWPAIHTTLH